MIAGMIWGGKVGSYLASTRRRRAASSPQASFRYAGCVRVNPIEGFDEDGHQGGVGVGHGFTSGVAGLFQFPIRFHSAREDLKESRVIRRRARRRARPGRTPNGGRR